jgi:hypothetical protein
MTIPLQSLRMQARWNPAIRQQGGAAACGLWNDLAKSMPGKGK